MLVLIYIYYLLVFVAIGRIKPNYKITLPDVAKYNQKAQQLNEFVVFCKQRIFTHYVKKYVIAIGAVFFIFKRN